jgi:hypothetical protein
VVQALLLAVLLSDLAAVFASLLVTAPDDWAATEDGADSEAAINSARALDETQKQFI